MTTPARTPTIRRILAALFLLEALFLLSPALLLAANGDGASGTAGRWLIDFNRDGSMELTLKRRTEGRGHWNWSSSNSYDVKDFQGLARPSGVTRTFAGFKSRWTTPFS